MSDADDLQALLTLLSDRNVRTILAETSVKPMSATELAERCPASRSTVYRRLEELKDHGLIAERIRIDPGGNHHEIYTSKFDRFDLRLRDGSYDVNIELTENTADRFTRLIEGIKRNKETE